MKVLTTATRRSREDLVHQIIDGGGTALALFILATSLLNVGDHAFSALIGEAVAHDVNERVSWSSMGSWSMTSRTSAKDEGLDMLGGP